MNLSVLKNQINGHRRFKNQNQMIHGQHNLRLQPVNHKIQRNGALRIPALIIQCRSHLRINGAKQLRLANLPKTLGVLPKIKHITTQTIKPRQVRIIKLGLHLIKAFRKLKINGLPRSKANQFVLINQFSMDYTKVVTPNK